MEKLASKEKSWKDWHIADEIREVFEKSANVILPKKRAELIELSLGNKDNKTYTVEYEVPGKGLIPEATVTRCKNGIAINYPDP